MSLNGWSGNRAQPGAVLPPTMSNKSHLTRSATLAIAASLALGSPPLLAQEVAALPVTASPPPAVVVPDVPPVTPPAAAPIVVPDVTVPEAAAEPAEPVAPTPRAEAPVRSSASPRAPAERPAAAVPSVPEPAPVAETPVDATAATEPEFAPVAVEPIAAPEALPTTEQTRAYDNTMAVVLGILAALALIVLGFFALRRKGPKRYAAGPRVDRPVPAVRSEPLAEPVAAPLGQALAYPRAAFGAAAHRPATGLSHAGAAVALPREIPQTYEEREALLKRMVAAKPDRANPFRSRRARFHRARLILASLGRDFKDADPWIDLSQYSSNWPELARRQSAAA